MADVDIDIFESNSVESEDGNGMSRAAASPRPEAEAEAEAETEAEAKAEAVNAPPDDGNGNGGNNPGGGQEDEDVNMDEGRPGQNRDRSPSSSPDPLADISPSAIRGTALYPPQSTSDRPSSSRRHQPPTSPSTSTTRPSRHNPKPSQTLLIPLHLLPRSRKLLFSHTTRLPAHPTDPLPEPFRIKDFEEGEAESELERDLSDEREREGILGRVEGSKGVYWAWGSGGMIVQRGLDLEGGRLVGMFLRKFDYLKYKDLIKPQFRKTRTFKTTKKPRWEYISVSESGSESDSQMQVISDEEDGGRRGVRTRGGVLRRSEEKERINSKGKGKDKGKAKTTEASPTRSRPKRLIPRGVDDKGRVRMTRKVDPDDEPDGDAMDVDGENNKDGRADPDVNPEDLHSSAEEEEEEEGEGISSPSNTPTPSEEEDSDIVDFDGYLKKGSKAKKLTFGKKLREPTRRLPKREARERIGGGGLVDGDGDGDVEMEDIESDSPPLTRRPTRSTAPTSTTNPSRKRKASRSPSVNGSDDDEDAIVERFEEEDGDEYRREKEGIESEEEEEEEEEEWEEEKEDPLKCHRPLCYSCDEKPAKYQWSDLVNRKARRKKKRKRKDDDDIMSDTQYVDELGGWVTCDRCTTASHWKCLKTSLRDALLAADRLKPVRLLPGGRLPVQKDMVIRCGPCQSELTKNCSICLEDDDEEVVELGKTEKGVGVEGEKESGERKKKVTGKGLMFRCKRCSRPAHYEHLPTVEGKPRPRKQNVATLAAEYHDDAQVKGDNWKCCDCRQYVVDIDMILAWRPMANANKNIQVDPDSDEPLHKIQAPREYLVKFKQWGFRHAEWLPHDLLASRETSKLRYFLENGPRKIMLESVVDQEDKVRDRGADVEAIMAVDQESEEGELGMFKRAQPNAKEGHCKVWSTPDRILEVWMKRGKVLGGHRGKRSRIGSDDEADGNHLERLEWPVEAELTHIDAYERARKGKFTAADAEELIPHIAMTYMKWRDLQYEACTYDTPIREDSPLYPAYLEAFRGFLYARTVKIPILKPSECAKRDNRVKGAYKLLPEQPPSVVGGENQRLMPFQLDGLNWLMDKWHDHTSVILADDMGLGKTVQIAAFLGHLGSAKYHVFPSLVVVPNSTLQNWMREFAKWVPHLRVVPFQGSKKSRDIIIKQEMYHHDGLLKCHVVLTTYEVITSRAQGTFAALKRVPRWETLIVDEATRLKSQSNLIVRQLAQLNIVHKVILTGTPLNNTVRELLNLMNFLDPVTWSNLDEMEKDYAELTEANAAQLREAIRPYMLRRRKDEVLDLPPKNEIIVPVSMRPLQKKVYKSVLERNAQVMKALAQAHAKGGETVKVTAAHNILMQLRKVLQHPFLYEARIEDRSLSKAAAHQALIDASAKLGFLKKALPKLKARGHRILLFSQFVIALNIIEDFLQEEGYKFLRLDGNTPQDDRQRDIDAFNAPDSDYFIYIISTRAGGMGINLATADTVIVHDADFNPHQDLQAIARAHRFGQKKKVLIMRLMTADTVEGRIMQVAKQKLVLDHLIVQTKSTDQIDNVAAIILDGAKAILESRDDDDSNDIKYDDKELTELIDKLESGEEEKQTGVGGGFSFAPVYDNRKGKLVDLQADDATIDADADYWADIMRRVEEEAVRAEMTQMAAGRRRRNRGLMADPDPVADEIDKDSDYEDKPPSDAEADNNDAMSGVADSVSELSGLDPNGKNKKPVVPRGLAGPTPLVNQALHNNMAGRPIPPTQPANNPAGFLSFPSMINGSGNAQAGSSGTKHANGSGARPTHAKLAAGPNQDPKAPFQPPDHQRMSKSIRLGHLQRLDDIAQGADMIRRGGNQKGAASYYVQHLYSLADTLRIAPATRLYRLFNSMFDGRKSVQDRFDKYMEVAQTVDRSIIECGHQAFFGIEPVRTQIRVLMPQLADGSRPHFPKPPVRTPKVRDPAQIPVQQPAMAQANGHGNAPPVNPVETATVYAQFANPLPVANGHRSAQGERAANIRPERLGEWTARLSDSRPAPPLAQQTTATPPSTGQHALQVSQIQPPIVHRPVPAVQSIPLRKETPATVPPQPRARKPKKEAAWVKAVKAARAEDCPACSGGETCIECAYGVGKQLRDVAESKLDTDADKKTATKALVGLLQVMYPEPEPNKHGVPMDID